MSTRPADGNMSNVKQSAAAFRSTELISAPAIAFTSGGMVIDW
jgi:hypothetical protein